jgi:hypothetical protein
MFANIKRKKLKVKKTDYRKAVGVAPAYDIGKLTKDELRFTALARPNLVVTVRRFTLVCELIEPANADRKQRTIYLASITEEKLTTVLYREKFWQNIDEKLKRLKLSPDVERTARAKINKCVPRPRG